MKKVFKKSLLFGLALVMLSACFIFSPAMTEVSATSENGGMTILNPSFPSILTESHPRAISGTVRSNIPDDIYEVVILVMDAYDNIILVSGSGYLPLNTRTYDLKNLDSLITFEVLSVGFYKIWVLVNFEDLNYTDRESFTLFVSAASASTSPSPLSAPTSISQGRGWPVTGTVSSDGNITKVWVGAYSTSTANPDSFAYGVGATDTKPVFSYIRSYDLAWIDHKVIFNNLPRGSYYYKVTIEIANGKRFTLINKAFSVV